MAEKEENKKTTRDDEIDLIEVALKIWAERRLIYKTVAIFLVIGLIVAFGSKKEYKSEVTFILEDNQGGSRMSGLLSQFGGIAGINFGESRSNNLLSPHLFPKIIQSTSFLVKLAQEPVYFEKHDTTYNLIKYFHEIDKPSLVANIKGFTIGLPRKLIGFFQKKHEEGEIFNEELILQVIENNKPLKLNNTEQNILEKISERIQFSFDEETGILSISTELPDPSAAAGITHLALQLLRKYIINYQTEKAITDLTFIKNQYVQAKEKFQEAQYRLANFRDQNLNVVTAKLKTREERLKADFNLAFNVYNGLAQQYEQAKIKVQEKTPIFKVVNEAKVPLERSKPSKSSILIVSLFLGLFFGLFYILIKMLYIKFRSIYQRKSTVL